MNIRFKLPNFEFEMQNVDVTRVDRALNGLFHVIDNGAMLEALHVKNDNAEEIPKHISPLVTFLEGYNEGVTKIEERPVNSARNFIEAVNGIRELNGVKLYQCSYRCGCGNKGKRYINEDAMQTTCHKCKVDLSVQRAVATEELTCDSDFDYFVAY